MIHFFLLMSRQGKVRLAKWYSTYSQKDRARAVKEITPTILARPLKLCNFLEWKNIKLVYKRYASLYFVCGIDAQDNELLTLEIIHQFVEVRPASLGPCWGCATGRGNACQLSYCQQEPQHTVIVLLRGVWSLQGACHMSKKSYSATILVLLRGVWSLRGACHFSKKSHSAPCLSCCGICEGLATFLKSQAAAVQVLDKYFGNVCELDLIFNFHKAYYMLDEMLIAGELVEPSQKVIRKESIEVW